MRAILRLHPSHQPSAPSAWWAGLGVVAGLATVAAMLSGCTGGSTALVAAPLTTVDGSATTSAPAEAAARTGASVAGRSSDHGPVSPSTAAASDVPAGTTKAAEPTQSAGKPALEQRPAADLTDEEIRRIYADDAAPGEPVTATLCNLTQEHLRLVEDQITGPEGVDTSNLRIALISLDDDLGVWEGLTWHLIDAAEDIETAREVYAYWDLALALQESGDGPGAQKQLNAAAEAIDQLPAGPHVELGCGR